MSRAPTTRLSIPTELVAAIQDHARSAYPEECCGLLIGRYSGAKRSSIVERTVAADNQREDESRHNRYLIDPSVVLRAERRARADGQQIVGYYHSHPDHPSAPSDFDREHAWPNTSYLIVAVAAGEVAGQQCWRLLDDRTAFAEEEIAIR